jgi:hypothetical protein
MISIRMKSILTIVLIFCVLVGTYLILNRMIVLDRTNQELATYDYALSPADVEVLVEGTGKQIISGKQVSTKLKIINIRWNNSTYNLIEHGEIEANEYLVVHNNRQVGGLQFIPGRSVYSMGTSYKRLKNGERQTIYLKFNPATNRFWIMPEELIEQ